MKVSRAGYYKHLKRFPIERITRRREAVKIVLETYEKHQSHGARWMTNFIFKKTGKKLSYSTVRHIFKEYGLKAKTRHRPRYLPRKEQDKFKNLIFATWDTVDRPRQVIVSDMTSFWAKNNYWEMVVYFDVFTKQVLSKKYTTKRGDPRPYHEGLQEVLKLLDGVASEDDITIIHTDQGVVYASKAYNDLIKDSNIKRSMSRAGMPTDNPVNEALNGRIKEELFVDYNLAKATNVPAVLDAYFKYFNEDRPSYALNYLTPNEFERRFNRGLIERKDTFKHRMLTSVPKFKQKQNKAL